MRRLRAPERLSNLVEAESLFNDGTGVVLFTLAVGGAASLTDGALSFIVVVGTSIVIGLVAGAAAGWLAGRVDDVNLELTLTLICAYGTYLVADGLHESGIIATVVAGIVLGNDRLGHPGPGPCGHRHRLGLPGVPADGHRVPAHRPGHHAFASCISALVGRHLGRDRRPRRPRRRRLRAVRPDRGAAGSGLASGCASHAAGCMSCSGRACAAPSRWRSRCRCPSDVPDRALLQSAVFGIVLFTLIVQGSTAGLMLRWAGAHRNELAARTRRSRNRRPPDPAQSPTAGHALTRAAIPLVSPAVLPRHQPGLPCLMAMLSRMPSPMRHADERCAAVGDERQRDAGDGHHRRAPSPR